MRCASLIWTGLLCLPLLAQAQADPASYSARYRLLFDRETVGESFFRLELIPDQSYLFEAYTQPNAKEDQDQAHEILESSSGTLDSEGIPRPESYYFSVFNQGQASLLEFAFDWAGKRLMVVSKGQRASLDLDPATQDRLSYLLELGRWLAADEAEIHFPIAQPGVTATAEFVRIETLTIEVQAGSFETVHLRRTDAGDELRRELWIELSPPHRLIAMERSEPNGIARMELISSTMLGEKKP